MAVNPADQEILTNSLDYYGEAIRNYREFITDSERARFRERHDSLDQQLVQDTDRVRQDIRRLEQLMERGDVDENAIYDVTNDLLDRAMNLSEKRGEHAAIGALLRREPGGGAREADRVLRDGDIFAGVKVPDHLKPWFEREIVHRLVAEGYARRHDQNDSVEVDSAKKIRETERGKIGQTMVRYYAFDETISIHERTGNPSAADKDRRDKKRLGETIARDTRNLFEDEVIRGVRSNGESMVWNRLYSNPTIGIQPPAPARAAGAVPAAPGAPIDIVASNVPPIVPNVTPAPPLENAAPIQVVDRDTAIRSIKQNLRAAGVYSGTDNAVVDESLKIALQGFLLNAQTAAGADYKFSTRDGIFGPATHDAIVTRQNDPNFKNATAMLPALDYMYNNNLLAEIVPTGTTLATVTNRRTLTPGTLSSAAPAPAGGTPAPGSGGTPAPAGGSPGSTGGGFSPPSTPAPIVAPTPTETPLEVDYTDTPPVMREVSYPDVLTQLTEMAKNAPVTAAQVLEVLGRSHSATYDAAKASAVLLPFIDKNYGIKPDDVITLGDEASMAKFKQLAFSATLYHVLGGRAADMQEAFEAAKVSGSDHARLQELINSNITAASQVNQTVASDTVQTEINTIDNSSDKDVSFSSMEAGDWMQLAGGVALTFGAPYLMKKVWDYAKPENKFARDMKKYNRERAALDADEERVKKLEQSAEDERQRLIRERLATPDDALASDKDKADRKALIESEEAKRTEAEAARRAWNEENDKLKQRLVDLEKRAADLETKAINKMAKRWFAERRLASDERRLNKDVDKLKDLKDKLAEERAAKPDADLTEREKAKRTKLENRISAMEEDIDARKERLQKVREAIEARKNGTVVDTTPAVTDAEAAEAERAADEARITKEVGDEFKTERQKLAELEARLKMETELGVADRGDGMVRSEEGHRAYVQDLQRQIDEARVDLEGKEKALIEQKRAETEAGRRAAAAEELGRPVDGEDADGRRTPTLDDPDRPITDVDGDGRREPTIGDDDEGRPARPDLERHADNQMTLDAEDKAIERHFQAIQKEKARIAQREADIEKARATMTAREMEAAEKKLIADKENLLRSIKDFEAMDDDFDTRKAAFEARGSALQTDVETHRDATIALDEERARLIAEKPTLADDVYKERAKSIQTRTQILNDQGVNIAERQAVHEGRAFSVIGEQPGTKQRMYTAFNAHVNNGSRVEIEGKLGRGLGLGFGGYSLLNRVFSEAGQMDRQQHAGLWTAGAVTDVVAMGSDLAEMRYARLASKTLANATPDELLTLNRFAKAGRVLTYADEADDALIAASRTLSTASKVGKFAAPVAIGATVLSSGIDFEIGRRNMDAQRSAEAIGMGAGGLLGAIGAGAATGAAIGVWGGGIGAVPGAIIGAGAAVVGGLGGGWVGKKVGAATLTGVFSKWFGSDEALAKAAQGGFDTDILAKFDKNNDRKLDLDEIKAGLESHGVTSITSMDRDNNGTLSTGELADTLRNGLSARTAFQNSAPPMMSTMTVADASHVVSIGDTDGSGGTGGFKPSIRFNPSTRV
jgi:hypothetical protein